MKRALIVIFFILLPAAAGHAQRQPTAEKALSGAEGERWRARDRSRAVASAAGSSYDVTYYRLEVRVSTPVPYIRGRVTVAARVLQDSLSSLIFDLTRPMQVDSVTIGQARLVFSQASAFVLVTLDRPYRAGENVTLTVAYEGLPASTGFGSFVFDAHAGTPWAWSLSEPYGARDWWPCKDQPADKADSSDIIVTCDSAFRVGSNGRLVSVLNNGDGTATWHWQERYPIAPYLISLALTNYSQFSLWFHYAPGDSMEVLNYFIPEHASQAGATLPLVIDMLRIYSDLFGLYPFIREKYGHAEINASSAMEHQTMTSLGPYGFDENTIAHELAHQWFGDMITCRTWPEIWLNEGFAQYSTALYLERERGEGSYRDYMEAQMFNALDARGTILIEDTSLVSNVFDPRLVYSKGASVLHMLRHVLGDSVFFRAMKAYATTPSLMYATAATEDFQAVCEGVSGRSLSFFFDEWIRGERYPRYSHSWSALASGSGYAVTLTISQTTGTRNPIFFTMPLEVRLSAPGWDTTVVVDDDAAEKTFTIFLSRKPVTVELDPGGWVLKTAAVASPLPASYSLAQNYPNPFNPATTVAFQIPVRSVVSLKIYDVLGQQIAVLADGEMGAGWASASWDGSGAASGIYFCRMEAASMFLPHMSFSATKKLVLLR